VETNAGKGGGFIKGNCEEPKELRSFIGAVNFFRRHIRNITETSAELSDLLKKGADWIWEEKHQRLFEELKRKITTGDCLGTPRAEGEYLLVTDASALGGGGSLFNGSSRTWRR
jgi:hypothetical protein